MRPQLLPRGPSEAEGVAALKIGVYWDMRLDYWRDAACTAHRNPALHRVKAPIVTSWMENAVESQIT